MREFDDLIEGNVNNIVDPTSLFEKSWRNRKRNESRLQDLCANACKFYKSLWNVPCVERENKKKKKKKKKEKDGNEKGNETRERNENRVNEVVRKKKAFSTRSFDKRYFLHVFTTRFEMRYRDDIIFLSSFSRSG